MIGMSYRKLKVWVKAMDLVDCIYDLTENFPKHELYGLSQQMRKAAVSIASNIAEGSQRSTVKDFANFVLIAKGSTAELETQLFVASKRKYAAEQSFQHALQSAEEVNKMLHAFHKTLLSNI